MDYSKDVEAVHQAFFRVYPELPLAYLKGAAEAVAAANDPRAALVGDLVRDLVAASKAHDEVQGRLAELFPEEWKRVCHEVERAYAKEQALLSR
jgi:hypothetical protein